MELFNQLNINTQIIGVIGHPIKHSHSPIMHNYSFERKGLNYIYLPFDVPSENLKSSLVGMAALGFKGMNVTLPHKEKISEYLDDISEEAAVVGSVNTVVIENRSLYGYNTDVHGIIESLNDYKDEINNQEVSVIGAGGAARSAIYSLIRHFKVSKINIINRTEQKAESLKEYFSAKMHYKSFSTHELFPPDIVDILQNSKLIINTTSIGMMPDTDDSATTIAESFLREHIVFDVIYNPIKTKFLALAQDSGATVINGLRMFVEQGAKSFELWTGEKMNTGEVYELLESHLDDFTDSE